MTLQFAMDLPIPVKGVTAMMELKLEPTATGTRLTQTLSRPTGPLAGRFVGEMGLKEHLKTGDADMAKFKAHVEADAASRHLPQEAPKPAEGEVRAAALESLGPGGVSRPPC
jgi:hypothetical protein